MDRDYLSKAQDVIEIDLMHLARELRKKVWQILTVCTVFAVGGFLFSYFTYVPTYTSRTTFVVSNKTNGVLSESDSLTSSDLSASTTLADTFKYILLSDEAMYSIIKMYQLEDSVEKLKNCIRIARVSNTNILEMSVVTNSAVLSRDIADRIIEYYPEVLARTLKSASLEILNWPRVARSADAYNGYYLYPLLAFLAALFGCTVVVYLKLVFEDTIKNYSDIHNKLNISLMASIPKVTFKGKKEYDRQRLLISEESSGFIFTESFKALRTKVETVSGKKGYKTFVVSSALENEGKTTIAINLALALAGNGKKVLLIDADLRKPSVYKYLGLTDGAAHIGIDRVLKGDTPFETAVEDLEKYGFSVLFSVRELSNSSELLSSCAMKQLISSVSDRYDYTIIDSPPASVLTDPAVLTAYTDAVILALRQDYASAALIDSVVQSLTESRAELIGCIFNLVDDRSLRHGGHGYRKYGKYGKYGGYGGYGGYEKRGAELTWSK